MDDDIVYRLRHVAWLAEEGSMVTDLAADAADEIERLRTENGFLREQVGNTIELITALRQARRG